MTDGKIEVNLGNLKFSAEGQQEWLGQQLDKILKAAPELVKIEPAADAVDASKGTSKDTYKQQAPEKKKGSSETLATYIKAKAGEDNQTRRFLATADWLRQKGEKLNTRAVTKALKDHHQRKLTNPAHCLNANVTKGFCEKGSDGTFFITPEGLKSLGHVND